MPRRFFAPLVVIACTTAVALPQRPIGLEQLARIARERLERQRPAQLAELRPFLEDLELDYRRPENRAFLEKRLREIAALGDGIVPRLLEFLTPAQEGDPAQRNLAANAARVLRHMDPRTFVDALLELAVSKSYTASLLAIDLLGITGDERAVDLLLEVFERLGPAHRRQAIHSLRRLGARQAAGLVASQLGARDRELRRAALEFLAALPEPAVLPTVLQALAAEDPARDATRLPLYWRYLERAAAGHAEAATALLRWLVDDALDKDLRTRVCRILAVVAPRGHEPTLRACAEILQAGETGSLGRACAVTMQALGDRSGARLLLERLKAEIARSRRDPTGWRKRGDAYFELGHYDRAIKDYQEAIDRSTSRRVREFLYLLIARCEARRRDRGRYVLKALKQAGLTRAALAKEAAKDPALAKALELPLLARWVATLPAR